MYEKYCIPRGTARGKPSRVSLKRRKHMIYLKEVDLTEIEIQKQKVEEAEAKLEKEKN